MEYCKYQKKNPLKVRAEQLFPWTVDDFKAAIRLHANLTGQILQETMYFPSVFHLEKNSGARRATGHYLRTVSEIRTNNLKQMVQSAIQIALAMELPT